MPTAPVDMMKLGPLPGFVPITYQLKGPKMKQRSAYFDLNIIPTCELGLKRISDRCCKEGGRPMWYPYRYLIAGRSKWEMIWSDPDVVVDPAVPISIVPSADFGVDTRVVCHPGPQHRQSRTFSSSWATTSASGISALITRE